MSSTRRNLVLGGAALSALGIGSFFMRGTQPGTAAEGNFEVTFSDAEWQKKLPPLSYQVLRHEYTERPGTSELLNEHRQGTFSCAGCALPLFDSATKYDSGTGWPSFYQPLDKAVEESVDYKLGYARREVHCRRCGGHLGHVFEDGPPPTGLRYCMNGAALSFTPAA